MNVVFKNEKFYIAYLLTFFLLSVIVSFVGVIYYITLMIGIDVENEVLRRIGTICAIICPPILILFYGECKKAKT